MGFEGGEVENVGSRVFREVFNMHVSTCLHTRT